MIKELFKYVLDGVSDLVTSPTQNFYCGFIPNGIIPPDTHAVITSNDEFPAYYARPLVSGDFSIFVTSPNYYTAVTIRNKVLALFVGMANVNMPIVTTGKQFTVYSCERHSFRELIADDKTRYRFEVRVRLNYEEKP